MKTLFAVTILAFAGAGCVSPSISSSLDLPFHPFERQLYVASSSIPHLTQSEWEEIKAQIQTQTVTEFDFHYAIRLDESLVRVDLVRKGQPPPGTGLSLFFEKKNGRWIENKAKAEEIVVLIPFR